MTVDSTYHDESTDSGGQQFNYLTSLDLTTCPNLLYLNCKGNSLTKLDLRKCKKLKELYCNDNCLTALNLKANKKLKKLNCSNNNLKKLVLPSVKRIKGDCRHNFLNRSYTLKAIRKMGKKSVKPQDKVSRKRVTDVDTYCKVGTNATVAIERNTFRLRHFSSIQIQIRKAGAKKWTTYNTRNGFYTFSNLKPNQKYVVRARAKLKVGKKSYYGKWSSTRSFKTK